MTNERCGWHRPPNGPPGQERHFIGTTAAIILGLSTAATTASSIYGAKKQASTAQKAADLTTRSSADQLTYLKEQAKVDQANYDKTAAEDKRRYDEQTAEARRQFEITSGASADLARKRFEAGAPYRALGSSAANTMGALLAKHFGGTPIRTTDAEPGAVGPPTRQPMPVPDPGPIFTASSEPRSTYGRMPTQRMADLLTPNEPRTDLARPGAMGEMLSPYVYLPDAGGRMIPVPRAMLGRRVTV